MNFEYIDKNLESGWEKLVAENPASGFPQSFMWTDFKNEIGWKTYKIGLMEEKQIIGGAIIQKFSFSKTKNFLYIPEGPVLPYGEQGAKEMFHGLMGEIDKIVNFKGGQITTHLRIDPRLAEVPGFFSGFKKAPFNMEPRDTLMIDLTLSEEDLLKQMKPKGRYNIKIAERNNVEVEIDSSQAGIGNFLSLYRQTTQRNEFEGKSESYFKRLFPHIEKNGCSEVFTAFVKDEPVASALVIFYGDRATYFFGGSAGKHKEKMAPYLLHWKIIQHAKQKGYKSYDLWGIAPEGKEDHAWHGITQFKKKLGGKHLNFIGSYDYIYNQKSYQEFLRESKEID